MFWFPSWWISSGSSRCLFQAARGAGGINRYTRQALLLAVMELTVKLTEGNNTKIKHIKILPCMMIGVVTEDDRGGHSAWGKSLWGQSESEVVSDSLGPHGHQAPPSMGFSRQEYWSGLPFPSAGDLLDPGIKARSPALQTDALPSEPPGKPHMHYNI